MSSRTVRLGLAVLAAVVVLAIPGIAAAQSTYTGTPPPDAGSRDSQVQVLSAGGSRTPVVASTGSRTGSAGTSRLAFTGADVLTILVVASGLVLGGTVLVRRARRVS